MLKAPADNGLHAEHVKYLVLDEADKMLSLGLQPQLKRIRVLAIPKKRKAEEGAGVLAKSPKKQKRPQVCPPNVCVGVSLHCLWQSA